MNNYEIEHRSLHLGVRDTISSILTTALIEILIKDVDNKCLIHPSAAISVRSNVCVRPEDGYNMSRNTSSM
jgi:hypothetical protein